MQSFSLVEVQDKRFEKDTRFLLTHTQRVQVEAGFDHLDRWGIFFGRPKLLDRLKAGVSPALTKPNTAEPFPAGLAQPLVYAQSATAGSSPSTQ
jgi:hypothetical protein